MDPIAFWTPGSQAPAFDPAGIHATTRQIRTPAHVVHDPRSGAIGVGQGGQATGRLNGTGGWPLLASLPALYPEWLGDRGFCEVHGVRFPYVTGAMANGIASTAIVEAIGRAGMLGFFGAAGLSPERVEAEIASLRRSLGDGRAGEGPVWGSNLIHSPAEPAVEASVADIYIRHGVRRVSAAAYMDLTPMLVRYAFTGVHQLPDGSIHRRNHVFAKVSRPEVAARFLAPPAGDLLDRLVASGQLTADEARLARHLPVAEDITVEADSGGHTDNRPLTALFPVIVAMRDRLAARHGFARPIRVGAAGGLGTPTAVAAAFSLGAAYVLTGSVNQGAVESGLSAEGKALLAQAGIADVVMAPAADMFEMGVEVQVLRRGTMFGVRARRLYELYRSYPSLEAIPEAERSRLEREILRQSIDEAWESTRRWWMDRDPNQVARAEADPHHKMALVFRAYLGQSSRWAIAGQPDRRADYQIWCGPAMGAFNEWVRGSFLEPPGQRSVVQIARNLLEGAAVITRAQQLRSCGVPVPREAFDFRPRPLA
ncbi:MAG: PfaD family polyunsaturated fatty acid/polyketide biosynthesis protein [Deltaproteobacteria bacterium]|nr:MAG: PfaD family polyunsaturated fatty acid/polyketide biosynthesis protein [Deltaproteobacteria bacterium]